LRFIAVVVTPTWAKGILLRRPLMVRLAERWQVDRRAIRFMQRLRRKHGDAALLVRAPGRSYVIPLSPDDVCRVLDAAQAFTPASREKCAALSHFEPNVSLITRGPKRDLRRCLNDDVLASGQEVHPLAGSFLDIVRDEAARLLQTLPDGATLTWPMFTEAWFAAVRQIVLGRRARDARDLTESLSRLRGRANWVYVRSPRSAERTRYYSRLAVQAARADPDSLAGAVARRPLRDDEQPLHQITHWLFAFDAGAITTFRALALFATHAQQLSRAAPDLAAWRQRRPDLPQLRAGFLDAVRLWPTTPLILRETTETTHWGAAVPKGSGVLIFAPFFHRDDERLAAADRFAPELWRSCDPADALPFVPFSAGPAACPGRHLVALIGAAWLAALLDAGHFTLLHPRNFGPAAPLPATLDHFSIALRYWAPRRSARDVQRS
jgi:cytochrome P450